MRKLHTPRLLQGKRKRTRTSEHIQGTQYARTAKEVVQVLRPFGIFLIAVLADLRLLRVRG